MEDETPGADDTPDAGNVEDSTTDVAVEPDAGALLESAHAKVAALTDQVAALTAEVNALKAHNYDLMMTSVPDTSGAEESAEEEIESDGDPTDELTLDDVL